VLLVDGDLRRGSVHRFFGVEREPGLSDVLGGRVALEEAIRTTQVAHFVPSGRIPANPAELLGSPGFRQFLEDVSRRYDLVIVDTPPVLAVTDPAIIGRHAGTNLLVLHAGRHSDGEIAAAVRRLATSGVAVQAAILNNVRVSSGRYGRYGRYYMYEYETERK
jgi:tyrosine-protein kinase Etk/Wzc